MNEKLRVEYTKKIKLIRELMLSLTSNPLLIIDAKITKIDD